MGPTDLPCNISNELPLCVAQYLRLAEISHDDLVMQALVWLGSEPSHLAWSSSSLHMRIWDSLTYLIAKFKRKN